MALNMLRGIVPPLVTPLADDDRLDVAGLERLVEHVVGGGVHGVFVLGTTGEAASLSPALRKELVDRTCKLVAGRVRVLVGITDTCVGESLALARHAAEAGAAAVVVAPPYYLPPDQEELVDHAKMIASEQPLPVVLYNIPSLTKIAYEKATVLRLSEVPRIIGIKDSSGELAYVRELLRSVEREDFSIMVGIESLIGEGVMAGADGGVPAGGNAAPGLFVEWYRAAMDKKTGEVAALSHYVQQLGEIYRVGCGIAAIVRGIKCAVACMGICDRRMARPFRSLDEAQRTTVRRILADLGLLGN